MASVEGCVALHGVVSAVPGNSPAGAPGSHVFGRHEHRPDCVAQDSCVAALWATAGESLVQKGLAMTPTTCPVNDSHRAVLAGRPKSTAQGHQEPRHVTPQALAMTAPWSLPVSTRWLPSEP